jgi:uncharacterized membrane protein YukC
MKKKLRVYQEDVKTRHTAHWDWDYLTWEEIEQRLKEAGVEEDQPISNNRMSHKKQWFRHYIWIGVGLLIVAVMVLVALIH